MLKHEGNPSTIFSYKEKLPALFLLWMVSDLACKFGNPSLVKIVFNPDFIMEWNFENKTQLLPAFKYFYQDFSFKEAHMKLARKNGYFEVVEIFDQYRINTMCLGKPSIASANILEELSIFQKSFLNLNQTKRRELANNTDKNPEDIASKIDVDDFSDDFYNIIDEDEDDNENENENEDDNEEEILISGKRTKGLPIKGIKRLQQDNTDVSIVSNEYSNTRAFSQAQTPKLLGVNARRSKNDEKNISSKKFKCSFCLNSFSDILSLNEHIEKDHSF